MRGNHRLKAKENVFQLTKSLSMEVSVNNSDTATRLLRLSVSKCTAACGFSVSEEESTDNQGKEARMVHAVINQRWRHQHELVFSLVQVKTVTYGHIYRYRNIQGLVYTICFPDVRLSDEQA